MTTRLAVSIDELLNGAIAEVWKSDADTQRQAKRVAAFAIAFAFWAVLFGCFYVYLGAPRSGLIAISAGVPILASLFVVRLGASPAVGGNLVCASGWMALTALGAINGGWTASPLMWYSALPVVAVLTAGVGWGIVWTVIPLVSVAVLGALQTWGVTFPIELPPATRLEFAFSALLGLIACQFVMAWVRVGIEQRALLALQETNDRLRKARQTLDLLETSFGFSMEEWARVQREKAALERFVRLRFGDDEADEEEISDRHRHRNEAQPQLAHDVQE